MLPEHSDFLECEQEGKERRERIKTISKKDDFPMVFIVNSLLL
jgi:hypothetical protein